jgi:hypothetical protein
MPSFRVTMVIGALRNGVQPQSVLPAAAAAAEGLATVEASDLAIVAGTARITVRFTAEDAELARQIGEHVVAATGELAETQRWQVTERVKSRWYPVG